MTIATKPRVQATVQTPAQTTDQPTDAAIIEQVLAGDSAPFRLLVERYQRAVFNASYRLVGDHHQAADIAQEAFVRAYRSLHTFRRDAPLAPWLCRIAINLSLNWLKRQRPELSLEERLEKHALELPDLSDEPQRRLLQGERQQSVREAVLALPPDQRAVIELRHFQELSYQEMAQILGISVSNVKVRLFRARKHLRQILEGVGER